jgi:hypothetical protein
MSSKPSFSLQRAVSAAFAFLPAGVASGLLPMLVLWALLSFGHTILFHFVRGGGFLVKDDCNLLVCGGFALLVIVLKLMTQGALYRAAVFGKDARKEGLGPLGLQFGAPELRLLASAVIIALFYLIVLLAIFIVFAVAFNSSGLAGDEPNTLRALRTVFRRHQGADWVFIVYLAAAHLFLIFLGIRFSLAHVATVARKKIVALNALGLASGNVFKLFCGLVLFGLPLVLSMAVVFHHVMPSLPRGLPRLLVHSGLLAFAVFVFLPLLAGFLSSAYKQISDLRSR